MRQTLSLTQLADSFGRQASRAANLTPVTRRASTQALGDVRRRFAESRGPDGHPWRPVAFRASGRGTKPLVDSGELAASHRAWHTPASFGTRTDSVQSRLQHFGGVVRATRRRFLAIPLTPEAARAGSPRRFGRPLRAVIGRGGRSGVLVERSGRGTPTSRARSGEALYALVKSVRVPGRAFYGWSDRFLLDLRRSAVNYITIGVVTPKVL